MGRVRIRGGVLVVAALVAALAAGCSDGASTSRSATSSPAAAGTTATDRVPADLAERLSEAGLRVIRDEAGATGGLAYTDWQVEAMTAGARGGTGLSGRDLDAQFALPAGTPPLSYFLGAWVSREGSKAAALASEIMGEQDWSAAPSVVVPTVVLALFVHDAIGDRADAPVPGATTPATGAAWPGGSPRAVLLAGGDLGSALCTTAQNFFEHTLSAIFDQVKLDPQIAGTSGIVADVGNFFAGLYNLAVDFAKSVVGGLLKALAEPVLQVLGTVITGIAVITEVTSYLTGWQTELKADRAEYRTGVAPGVGDAGTVTMTSTGLAKKWPKNLRDCAGRFGVKEPTGLSEGSPVTWTTPVDGQGHVVFDVPATTTVNASSEATYGFHAEGQPAKVAASKKVSRALFAIEGSADSSVLAKLRELLTSLLDQLKQQVVAKVPNATIAGVVDGVISTLFAPLKALILSDTTARKVLGLSASTAAFVEFHVADDPVTTTSTPRRDLCADAGALGALLGTAVSVSADPTRIARLQANYRQIVPTVTVRGCGFSAGGPGGLNGSVAWVADGGRAVFDRFIASSANDTSGGVPTRVAIGDAGLAASTAVSANVIAVRGDTMVQVILTDSSRAIGGDEGQQASPAMQGPAEAVARAAVAR